MAGFLYSFRWHYMSDILSDVFTDSFLLASVHNDIIDPEIEPWERFSESWFHADPQGLPFVDVDATEKLEQLLQNIRVRSYRPFFIFNRPPTYLPIPEFPVNFTYVFWSQAEILNGNSNLISVSFQGYDLLVVQKTTADHVESQRFFRIHSEDQGFLVEILNFLESDVFEFLNIVP